MPETSIAELMTLMYFYQCDGYPVAIDGEIVGFVQLRDVLTMLLPREQNHQKAAQDIDINRLQQECGPLMRATVKQVMDGTIKSVSPLMPIGEAMEIMFEHKVDKLVVTEDDKMVGMISFDVVNRVISGLASNKVAA